MMTQAESLKRLVPVLIPIVAAALGAVGSGAADVTGARAWQEDKARELAAAELSRARIVALEAQQEILMRLASQCALGTE